MASRHSRSPDGIDILVGQRLMAFREGAGLTRADVAKAVGVTFQQVEKYEKGANRVAASRLYRFARFFGCPIGAFFPVQEGVAPGETSPLDEMGQSRVGWRVAELFMGLSERKRSALLAVAEALVEPVET